MRVALVGNGPSAAGKGREKESLRNVLKTVFA